MYIYKITDTSNNKIYIGLCSRPLSKSKWYFGGGKIISAISKIRKHTLTKDILEDGFTSLKALREAEIRWIKTYRSNDPNFGYNLSRGGDITKPKDYKRSALSEDHKRSIGDSSKGSKWYYHPETKESHMFHENPGLPWIKGRPSTDIYKGPKNPESVQKMRKSLTGKKYSDDINKKKGKPGKHWYHNPDTLEQRMTYECPEGFIPGRLN